MKKSEIIDRSTKFAEPYSITNGKKFRLKDVDPADMGKASSEDKPRAKELLENGIQALAELQDVLYAQDQWSVLLIFQAMDAAGKDGAIKHVMSGVNPQGCQVYSFKSPSAEDINHDYLLKRAANITRCRCTIRPRITWPSIWKKRALSQTSRSFRPSTRNSLPGGQCRDRKPTE